MENPFCSIEYLFIKDINLKNIIDFSIFNRGYFDIEIKNLFIPKIVVREKTITEDLILSLLESHCYTNDQSENLLDFIFHDDDVSYIEVSVESTKSKCNLATYYIYKDNKEIKIVKARNTRKSKYGLIHVNTNGIPIIGKEQEK